MTDRVVIDTNVLISAALVEDSAPGRARLHALAHAVLIGTDATFAELVGRLLDPRFDRYLSSEQRQTFLERLQPLVKIVPVVHLVKACRDPRDDKFLEAAVNGRADVLISGDKDLLVLHPFRGIAILSPSAYLARVAKEEE